jgi:hypothetical protein
MGRRSQFALAVAGQPLYISAPVQGAQKLKTESYEFLCPQRKLVLPMACPTRERLLRR